MARSRARNQDEWLDERAFTFFMSPSPITSTTHPPDPLYNKKQNKKVGVCLRRVSLPCSCFAVCDVVSDARVCFILVHNCDLWADTVSAWCSCRVKRLQKRGSSDGYHTVGESALWPFCLMPTCSVQVWSTPVLHWCLLMRETIQTCKHYLVSMSHYWWRNVTVFKFINLQWQHLYKLIIYKHGADPLLINL